ncbi:Ankyrin repeat and IBR domain-containing protein 1 [Liparis tanakae]|uniref:Ankyrin repeat and IBR domain-containing protein 1 n=1 Tax=Liparis tanakae TaxID=230148 RepID=A0A4Z2EZ18_9TELE|nr:Ankyrin repeat and IBR domain-containing protein 1 [Liparis tanakae]
MGAGELFCKRKADGSALQKGSVATAERHWDREKLLEAWMSDSGECCQRSGVQMPNPPPSGYNAWDTLPSPRTPRATRCSAAASPQQVSLLPAGEEASLVRRYVTRSSSDS